MDETVSVIIPTYRRLETLKKALLSISSQDYHSVEIVLVDDNADEGWTQKVASVADEAAQLLPASFSLRLIVNPKNLGAAQSRNEGIRASSGSYITFLDDDDWYLPAKISTQLAAMTAANADYSLMDLTLFNEELLQVERKTHPYAENITEKADLLRLHLMHHLTGTDTMMFRRDYLFQIGCFDAIDVGDEFYLMMKAIENGGRFLYIPKALVHALVHYDGTGLSGGPLKFQGEELLFRFKQQYFPLLKPKEIRYIRMRHHAVLAFAHLKLKNKTLFVFEALKSLALSPFECVSMLYRRHRK